MVLNKKFIHIGRIKIKITKPLLFMCRLRITAARGSASKIQIKVQTTDSRTEVHSAFL